MRLPKIRTGVHLLDRKVCHHLSHSDKVLRAKNELCTLHNFKNLSIGLGPLMVWFLKRNFFSFTNSTLFVTEMVQQQIMSLGPLPL